MGDVACRRGAGAHSGSAAQKQSIRHSYPSGVIAVGVSVWVTG